MTKREAIKLATEFLGRCVNEFDAYHIRRELRELRRWRRDTVAAKVMSDNIARLLREYDVPERLCP